MISTTRFLGNFFLLLSRIIRQRLRRKTTNDEYDYNLKGQLIHNYGQLFISSDGDTLFYVQRTQVGGEKT
jgi:hypothetical protein